MRKYARLLLVLVIFIVFLLGCGGSKTLEGGNNPHMIDAHEQNSPVRLEEVIRNAPTDFTARKDWSQWESTYVGKRVEGKGRVVSVSVHPQDGKLFFIATIIGNEDINYLNGAQVALLVEDAHNIALGEEEGSFLLEGIKWVQLGDIYTFQGRVSKYSWSDPDLISLGQGAPIVLRVLMKDIDRE